MFKFLRKYNKLLLAIFGVLLMITFLIPQAMSRMSSQSGASSAVVATVGDGEKVRADQWHRVQAEMQFMQRLGLSVQGVSTAQDLKPEHWYLLVREAEAAGLVANGASVQIPDSTLLQIAMRTEERNPEVIRNSIAKLDGVNQLIWLYRNSGTYSDRRLSHAAERMLSQVVSQVVVIKASEKTEYQPTEEQISAQFAKYADVEPGTGEHGFGYKLPDRAKLEWIHVPTESVREVVRKSEDFSPVKQRLHWRKYESDTKKGFPKADGGAIPEVVSKDLLEQLTTAKLEEISKFAADQLRLNRRGIPEKDGYVVLPADWRDRQLAFPQLAADIQGKFGIALPRYESSGDRWTAAADVSSIPGLGRSLTDKFGAQPVMLTQLVQAAKEFNREKSREVASVFVQKDVAGPPLKDVDGSVYVFRITDVEPTHAPTAVSEVRDAVIADLRRMEDYKHLAETVSDLEREAESKGLLGFAMSHDTTMEPPATISLSNRFVLAQAAQSGLPVKVSPTDLPVVGPDRATVETVLNYAAQLPNDKSIDELPEEQRVLAVAVPGKLAVVVFRLMRMNPLTQEDYVDLVQKGGVQQLLTSEDSKDPDAVKKAFGFDAMAKRNNFAFIKTRPDEAPAEAANAG